MSTHHTSRMQSACPALSIRIIVLALAFVTLPCVTSAQSVGDSLLRVGSRVRVATVHEDSAIGTRRAIGVVQSLAGDAMTVTWDNGLRSTITNANISRIDVSEGKHPFIARGMGIGFVSGVVVGAVVGALTYEPSTFLDFGIGVHMAGGGIVLGLAGTVLGGIVGASGERERWSRLQLPASSQRLSIAPFVGTRAQGVKVFVRF